MVAEVMRLGSRALSIILGGPGIFYLWHSFYVPVDAARAVIFLGAATALNLLLYPEVLSGRRVAGLNRLVTRVIARFRRF